MKFTSLPSAFHRRWTGVEGLLSCTSCGVQALERMGGAGAPVGIHVTWGSQMPVAMAQKGRSFAEDVLSQVRPFLLGHPVEGRSQGEIGL